MGNIVQEKRHWYFVHLDRMAQKAQNACSMQELIERGEDLKTISITEGERVRIVAQLDYMLAKDASGFEQDSIKYLVLLRHQIAEGCKTVVFPD